MPSHKIFVDIGAYTGDTIIQAMRKYPDFDLFVGFEPDPKLFAEGKKRMGFSKRIVFRKECVSDYSGKIGLFFDNRDYEEEFGGIGNSLFATKEGCDSEPKLVDFTEGMEEIPSCYYEFALRYPKDGELFQGFVAASADKIFESTHNK